MASPRPRLYRDCLQDAVLAPVMTEGLWESLGELAKRYPAILGLLAYILDMAKEDESAMPNIDLSTEKGALQMSHIQGQHYAKRMVVGRICDLMGDLAMSEAEVVGEHGKPADDDAPAWAFPDDHEEEERRERRAKRATRPRPRSRPSPAPRNTPKKGRRK